MSKQTITEYLERAEAEQQPQKYRAMMLAGNTVLALLVVVLLLIWISRMEFNQSKEVKAVPGADGRSAAPDSLLDEIDFDEPNVESTLDEDLRITPAVLSELPGSVRANLSQLTKIGLDKNSDGNNGGRKKGPDPTPIDHDLIPESQRWRLTYVFQDRSSYYRQIDFLGIELAAADPKSPQVDYVSSTNSSPVHRTGIRKDENRLCFRCSNTKLMHWDILAMQSAGMDTTAKIMLQFYPETLRTRLLRLEKEKLDGIELIKVEQTRFEVAPEGDSFSIRVRDIKYR